MGKPMVVLKDIRRTINEAVKKFRASTDEEANRVMALTAEERDEVTRIMLGYSAERPTGRKTKRE
jgi:hypothetical protein